MVKKAVLIGINYNNSSSALNGCINDVNNIRNILINNCGYNPSNIRLLTEESQILPIRDNMEKNITWLVSNNVAGDTLFFYYSGHGSSIKDNNADETDGKDEVLVPLDYTTKGVITDDWLFNNMAAQVPANVTLWAFTDCCHSGTMIDLKYNYNSMCALKTGTIQAGMQYNSSEWNDKFSFNMERSRDLPGNVYLFSGCQDPQTSADAFINRVHQGAFTYCLVEFMKTNMTRMPDGSFRFNNGTVKLRNLLKEVNCRLDINGFGGQDTQLSMTKQSDFERTFDP